MGGDKPIKLHSMNSVYSIASFPPHLGTRLRIAQRFCYQLSLPTCESSAYVHVVEPSKNASNIVNLDYIVSLTVNALHSTYREVVLFLLVATKD